uniref:Acyl-coenzyme A dehydrogenase n=1 Tax=uncultured bacterium Ak20-3 TaxID=798570 RepID=D9MX63_9BACT|nr:hypothetical protein AKSOIL_0332 [uncultured bacterium Ak20-3]
MWNEWNDFLAHLGFLQSFFVLVITFLISGLFAFPFALWASVSYILLYLFGAPSWLLISAGTLLLIFAIPMLRKFVFTANVMRIIRLKKLLPVISETEQTALEAGSIWADGELFKGNPDLKKLMSEPLLSLTEKEKQFIAGPCEELCKLCDDEQTYIDQDLSEDVWNFLKKEKFLGLCIPEQYGGLGFSASAHSEVIHKISSKSIPLAITTMVPNSLGPAELIMHYGTDQQKNHYLPRLATGQEIPCFGLTEPNAGSDAGSIQAQGIVFKGSDGELYLRLNWKKRYITLGAVSTVLGLAVKIFDPELFLGKGADLGITCVLVPSHLEGVKLGLRHNPLGVPFCNSPIEGRDVVVSINQVIGGLAGVGQGWRMLMECLAAGRSISLPTYSVAASKKILRATSSYVKVRQQFGVPIWQFEGIDEVLAEMTALTYIIEASRLYTVAALDSGVKPAVVSAITKYQSTELHRSIATKAMDIWGGAGISLGAKNVIARFFTSSPISITVEGANILTRSMIIFGQGAIRCHPFAYSEIKALQDNNVTAFDRAFMGHIGRIVQNLCRLLVFTLTRARFSSSPASKMAGYYQKLNWASTSFVVVSEAAMILFGGNLKFKEKLAGRFADVLSWMYLVTSTLRRYEESKNQEDEAVVHYALQLGFQRVEQAFQGIFQNFDIPGFGFIFKKIFLPWSRINSFSALPSDRLGSQITRQLVSDAAFRERLTSGLFLSKESEDRMMELEEAYALSSEVDLINRKIVKGIKEGTLSKGRAHTKLEEALEKGVIQKLDATLLSKYKAAHDSIVAVDAYEFNSLPVSS